VWRWWGRQRQHLLRSRCEWIVATCSCFFYPFPPSRTTDALHAHYKRPVACIHGAEWIWDGMLGMRLGGMS
jgi:hypothetical protein